MRKTENRSQKSEPSRRDATVSFRTQHRSQKSVLDGLRSPVSGLRSPVSSLQSEHGIALVLTLSILALVLIMLVGFVVSMRVEHAASKNFNDLIKARQLAQGAVDQAVATIRSAATVPTTSKTWVAAPGVIYITDGSGSPIRSNLYTDASVLNTGTVDLNAGGFITGANSYYDASSVITAGWQNVTGPGNELIGRFAYWVDVETTKLDINTAHRRSPPDPQNPNDPLLNQSVPRDVDVRVLETPFYQNMPTADALWDAHSNPPPQPWFSTVEEMRRAFSPPLSKDSFRSNLFFMTANTSDTNTDAFGRARIDVTAINSDSAPAYTTALTRFGESFWGQTLYNGIVSSGRDSFEKKYGEFGVRQILANIVEYQNPVEKSVPVGNATLDGDGLPRDYSGLKKCPMISDVVVHVTTNAVPSTTPGLIDLVVGVFVDVRLLNIYNQNRGAAYQILVEPALIEYTAAGISTPMTVGEQSKTIDANRNVSQRSYALLGNRSTSTAYLATYPPPFWSATINGTVAGVVPIVDQVKVRLRRVRLLNTPDNPNSIVDWMSPADFTAAYPADMVFAPAQFVPYAITPPGGAATDSPSFSSSSASPTFQPLGLHKLDPRTRTFSGSLSRANGGPPFTDNWRPLGPDDVDTASINPSWTAAKLAGKIRDELSPQVYALLSDVRSMEPGPGSTAGTGTVSPTMRWLGDYREGPMQSLGELTYIHTGYPHRTLRFRSVIPRTSGASTATPWADNVATTEAFRSGCINTYLGRQTVEQDAIPDWVLLDIFTVGPSSIYSGRVNLNTRFSGPALSLRPRVLPIAALFNDTSVHLTITNDTTTGTNLVSAVPGSTFGFGIASNVANRVFENSPVDSPYRNLPVYFTPGEICEVRDLEYFTDIVHNSVALYNNTPSKRRRQQAIRRVSNLITARSNLFTIWGIAQTIKEVGTPNGTFDDGQDFVTGEVKVQAIVERYEENNEVKFRTRYYRFIYD